MSERKVIGLRDVRELAPGQVIWDAKVRGFGARRQQSPAVSYVLFYRTKDGRQRWSTIGRHGSPWTPETARKEARRLLGEVETGADPSAEKKEIRKAASVAELCDRYLADAEAGGILRRGRRKKPSTLATDKGRVARHIKPILGSLKVRAVTRRDVERFYHAVSEGATAARVKTGKRGLARVTGGQGTAKRTLALLGVIFSYGVKLGLRTDNPAHGIETHAYNERQRRASDAEYAALAAGLVKAGNQIWPPAVAAARFLALTGWRRGEVLGLTWSAIDLERRTAILDDTKTGRSVRPLSKAACDVLRGQSRAEALVFPATRGDGPMAGFPSFWKRIAAFGGLPDDVTPHVLRHSFASVAADLGFSELTIAVLLGHRKASVTSKYTHHADAVLLGAADAVAERVSELMKGEGGRDENWP